MTIKELPNKRSALNRLAVLILAGSIAVVAASCSSNTTPPTEMSTASTLSPTAAPTDSLLGDVSHFGPIALYPAIAKYAGDNLRLSYINIYYVRADGTLNLTAKYKPHVDYNFFRLMDGPPPDAPPVGAGGKLNERWYQPVYVDIEGPDSFNEKPQLRHNNGKPTNSTQQAIPAPTCSLKQFWSVALEKGAPRDAVATIYYSNRGYSFSISDTSVRLEFNNQCAFTQGVGLTPEPTDTPVPITSP